MSILPAFWREMSPSVHDVNYFEIQGLFLCLVWGFFLTNWHFREWPDYLWLSAISTGKGSVRNYRLFTSKVTTPFDLEKQQFFSVIWGSPTPLIHTVLETQSVSHMDRGSPLCKISVEVFYLENTGSAHFGIQEFRDFGNS